MLRPKDDSLVALGERRWVVSVALISSRLLRGLALTRAQFYADSATPFAAIEEVRTLLASEGVGEANVVSIEAEKDPW